MSWKAILEGKIFYFFFHLRGWGGWVRGEMENSIFFLRPSLIFLYLVILFDSQGNFAELKTVNLLLLKQSV